MSAAWHSAQELDAVFVTHLHPDHLDPRAAVGLSEANPNAVWYAEPAAKDLLPAGAKATALQAGVTLNIGDLTIEVVGGRHAVIHPDLPGSATWV